jgi:hypothetical protein
VGDAVGGYVRAPLEHRPHENGQHVLMSSLKVSQKRTDVLHLNREPHPCRARQASLSSHKAGGSEANVARNVAFATGPRVGLVPFDVSLVLRGGRLGTVVLGGQFCSVGATLGVAESRKGTCEGMEVGASVVVGLRVGRPVAGPQLQHRTGVYPLLQQRCSPFALGGVVQQSEHV